MAYDPNDPEDKKIVAKLIADALAEAQAEHEGEVEGLKSKNKELLGKLKKAQSGEGDPAEVARLEGELETAKAALKTAEKNLKTVTTERDNFKNASETESNFARNLLVDNALTDALVGANIAKQFMPAVKAMLAGKASVKAEGDNRQVVVGDKTLGDFVKEWSQGDEGKHYVSAPANGGAGATGGKAGGGDGKTMTREAYNELNKTDPLGASKFFSEGGTLSD